MVKGVPTARFQSYKANQTLQEKKFPTPTTSGNDVLPSPIIIPAKPATHAKGAQLAFTTICVLQQSLLHAVSPGNHIYDMLQLMGPYLCNCSQWYDEEQAHNTALQQQFDAVNSKLLDQSSIHNAEIFALQGLLAKSQEAQEFYIRQALQVDMVPPRRRHRFVSSEADNALISNCCWLVMIFSFVIAPLRCCRFSRLSSIVQSSTSSHPRWRLSHHTGM